jgi:hypothetical protein
MTQYAFIIKNTRVVEGFAASDELPTREGYDVYPMSEPVQHFPQAPSDKHVLKWLEGESSYYWEVTTSLEELRIAKNAEINAARLLANLSFFTYQGKQISCDTLSRGDIDAVNGYVTLTGSFRGGWPGAWKAVDNTYVPINSLDDWKAFYGAMVDQGQANFAKAQQLKQELAEASTAEEVAAISW